MWIEYAQLRSLIICSTDPGHAMSAQPLAILDGSNSEDGQSIANSQLVVATGPSTNVSLVTAFFVTMCRFSLL